MYAPPVDRIDADAAPFAQPIEIVADGVVGAADVLVAVARVGP